MKKQKHACCRCRLYRSLIGKFSSFELFWLCLGALIVLGLAAVFAPAALVGLF